MNEEEYINNITLEYLLNPYLYEKIHAQKNISDKLIFKDIKFYRRRICQLTKDMCKGEFIDNNLKTLFLNYSNTIIYHLKQLDEKDILQADYNELDLDIVKTNNIDISNSCENNVDNLLLNIPKPVNNLDNFVKKINIQIEDKILPQKRIANIKEPALKKKGEKKKISD